ncbi:AAA-domain-containing protein [Gonapodya prolifera JEL478]|uniref:AAA-domain-containing protein n=1 Tax=Gonapodya prolifera (strain JEL478) TaxID=1344416 RepID=A0A139ANW3_GONPJ|nr:AAA-domain-containing protein [Gonapodya prolifera JEL478]|eukprot:KXS18426.1 AAA-domain-containing protein [Gonapodya prolifera JEL478]
METEAAQRRNEFQTGREKLLADTTNLPGWRPAAPTNGSNTGPPAAAPPGKRTRFNPPAIVGPNNGTDGDDGSNGTPFGFYAFNRPQAPPAPSLQNCYSVAGTNRKKVATPVPPSGPAGSRRGQQGQDEVVDERLRNVDPKMVEMIEGEMVPRGQNGGVEWDDIAGLRHAKAAMTQAIIWPMQRPELFTGLRAPPRGVLLYGPPGTGKTLIAKAIAAQCNTDFFSISASTLTSKWVGEGEKMMRALFAVARVHQPAVIFIDEIDSLLTARSDGENEGSRRLKTEFLVQVDGCNTNGDDRVLLIGATNRPHELDEAARRRFTKMLYIPLPDRDARKQLLNHLLGKANHRLTDEEISMICDRTEGYSGSDIHNLCRDAVMCPITSVTDISLLDAAEIRAVMLQDFETAMGRVKPTVAPRDLEMYLKFEKEFGSLR